MLVPTHTYKYVTGKLSLELVEEKEGEDGEGESGCWTLAVREFGWRKTLIFVMCLPQNISFRDNALHKRDRHKAKPQP